MGVCMIERISIIQSQANVWDYAEFTEACIKQGKEPLFLSEWSGKMGLLHAAMFKYPDLDPIQAYLLVIEEANKLPASVKQVSGSHINDDNTGCNTCGGGTVL